MLFSVVFLNVFHIKILSHVFFKGKFKGTSEADECYVGGLEQNKHTNKKGQDDKACVFGMINRNTKQAKVYHVSSNEKDVLLGKINISIAL